MLLSEAIRAGALLRPQATNDHFAMTRIADGTLVLGSCALGAAYEHSYGPLTGAPPPWAVVNTALYARFGAALRLTVSDPVTGFCQELGQVITTLNDYRRWSRERIADWVATVEQERGS